VQLVEEGAETLSSILTDSTLWMGEKGEVAENILDKVYKERLNEEERKLLQYISLYRGPVSSKAIVVAASDSRWSEAVVKKTALRLIRNSLLQKTGENYGVVSLIHNYAYIKLIDRVERHKRACLYYLSLPLPEKRTKKEDVLSLIEACHHACAAGDYDMAADIIFDNKLHEDLDRWGNYTTIVELYENLLPERVDKERRLTSVQTHGAVLGNLGNAYYALGEVERAVEYYEQALVIAKEIGDRRGEGNRLGSLGNAYYALGQVERAIEFYEQALVIAKEIGDRRGEGTWLGSLGLAYAALGQVERVVDYHEQALVIAKEIGDRRGEGNQLGNLGSAYADQGQVEHAIDYHEQALVIAKEIGDRRGEGAWLNNLGVVFTDIENYDLALACYLSARKIRRELKDPEIETTENNINTLKTKLGERKFQKLLDTVEPNAEEIIQGILAG
jgi:tetratricopeptide (TPR) repeat protein